MGERNTSPSPVHWWKCRVDQQHTRGMLVFIQHVWNPLCKDWNFNPLSPITIYPPYSVHTPPPYQSTVVLSHRKPASALTSHDSCSAQVRDERYALWYSSDHELGFHIEGQFLRHCWLLPPEFYNCSCFNLDSHVCYTQESEHCMLSPKVWYLYMSVLCYRCWHLLGRVSRMCEDLINWTVCIAHLNVAEHAVL